MDSFESLLNRVQHCTLCASHLSDEPRPVVQIQPSAKLLIIGQAPGRKVHETGIPFNDASGERLRQWLGINANIFYDKNRVAIVPMGFCYPGKGKSGDLPPRPECIPTWHAQLLSHLKELKLTLLIGQYAQHYYLPTPAPTLTKNVQNWRQFGPKLLPLPHPSPRNNIWLKRNLWFEQELVPELRKRVATALDLT